jgi:hypothetical protein
MGRVQKEYANYFLVSWFYENSNRNKEIFVLKIIMERIFYLKITFSSVETKMAGSWRFVQLLFVFAFSSTLLLAGVVELKLVGVLLDTILFRSTQALSIHCFCLLADEVRNECGTLSRGWLLVLIIDYCSERRPVFFILVLFSLHPISIPSWELIHHALKYN